MLYKWLMQLRFRFSYRRPSVLHVTLCWIFGLLIGIFFALLQDFGSLKDYDSSATFTYSHVSFILFSLSGILLAYLFLAVNRLLFNVIVFIRAFLQGYCLILLCVHFNAYISLYALFSQTCNNCILLLTAFLCAKGMLLKSIFGPTINICVLFSLVHLMLL